MSAYPQQPTGFERPGPAKVVNARLFDVINIPLLLGVLICFFLPLCTVTCEGVKMNFTGMNLATGSMPEIEGMGKDERGEMSKDMPKDPLILAMPILAVVGIVLVVLALVGRVSPGNTSPGLGAGAGVAALLIVVILGYYAAAGFKVENKAKEDAKGSVRGPKAKIETTKTTTFWVALGASALVIPLAFLRGKSPRLGGSSNPPMTPPQFPNQQTRGPGAPPLPPPLR